MTKSTSVDKYAALPNAMNFEVEHLTPALVKEIELCNGYKAVDSKRHFDYLARNYDGIYNRIGFLDPSKTAEKSEKHAKARGLDIANCRVLVVCCGTGLVGQELAARGFKQITGIDFSESMLEMAADKKVYTDLQNFDINDHADLPK